MRVCLPLIFSLMFYDLVQYKLLSCININFLGFYSTQDKIVDGDNNNTVDYRMRGFIN